MKLSFYPTIFYTCFSTSGIWCCLIIKNMRHMKGKLFTELVSRLVLELTLQFELHELQEQITNQFGVYDIKKRKANEIPK